MNNFIIEPRLGSNFNTIAKEAKTQAVRNSNNKSTRGQNVEFNFNGITCIVSRDTNLENLYRDYNTAHKLNWKIIGPDCKEKYDAKITNAIKKYNAKRKKEIKEEEKKQEEIRKARPTVRKFSMLQLFSILDGRMSTSIGDVYEMLNHITGEDLMTHHLPVAMNYIKKVNPQWFEKLNDKLTRIKAYVDSNTFEILIGVIKDKYNEEYDIPTLTAEEKKDFGNFMVDNSLLLKKMKTEV